MPSLYRSSASSQGWEARAAVSSAPIEAQTLQLSESEDLDVVSAYARDTEDLPPQCRMYVLYMFCTTLVEAVPRAVEKLSIDWPAERENVRFKGKLDNWLILAQSHRDVVLAHKKELGLWLNAKRSVLSPLQRTTF